MKAFVGGSWEVLASGSCMIRSSSRSFCDDRVKFFYGPGMKILLKVFYDSLCEGLVEILVKCCQGPLHDLVQVLEKLLKRSW